jgi:hypothetical protein
VFAAAHFFLTQLHMIAHLEAAMTAAVAPGLLSVSPVEWTHPSSNLS